MGEQNFPVIFVLLLRLKFSRLAKFWRAIKKGSDIHRGGTEDAE
jgi:hypothetical protein